MPLLASTVGLHCHLCGSAFSECCPCVRVSSTYTHCPSLGCLKCRLGHCVTCKFSWIWSRIPNLHFPYIQPWDSSWKISVTTQESQHLYIFLVNILFCHLLLFSVILILRSKGKHGGGLHTNNHNLNCNVTKLQHWIPPSCLYSCSYHALCSHPWWSLSCCPSVFLVKYPQHMLRR